MSRFFLTTSAAKPVEAGGYSFVFKPVALRGGTWLGILAVEDDLAASSLANAQAPNVEEIPSSTYEDLKKKHLPEMESPGSSPSPPPVQLPGLTVAEPVGRPTAPTTVKQNSTEMITPVTLFTTRQQPPVEPLLETKSTFRRPR